MLIYVPVQNPSWTFASVVSTVKDIVFADMIPDEIEISTQDHIHFQVGYQQVLVNDEHSKAVMEFVDYCKDMKVCDNMKQGTVKIRCVEKKIKKKKAPKRGQG